MSKLSLNTEESEYLVREGWTVSRTTDGPEFTLDFGQRSVLMFPVIKRNLSPMIFRTQARRYDLRYSNVAKELGWGGPKALPSVNTDQAMSTFKIDKFDEDFAAELTLIMKKWTLHADIPQLVADSIERRKRVRVCLYLRELIDYAFLGQIDEIRRISLSEKDDGTEYLSSSEDPMLLQKALKIAELT